MRKTRNPVRIISYVYPIVGAVLLIAALANALYGWNWKRHAETTTAVITDSKVYGSDRSNSWITYTAYGKVYKDISIDCQDSRYRIGDEITIWFNPENPAIARTDEGLFLLSYIFGGIGLIFVISGFIFMSIICHRDRRIRFILEDAEHISLVIDEVRFNRWIQINCTPGMYLVCHDPKTGLVYKSRYFYDRQMARMIERGDSVDMFISNRDPRLYYIDLDSLAERS